MEEQFIEDMRRDYTKFGINESDLKKNPYDQFENWFNDAKKSKTLEANAVILSTASASGTPSSRVVLIKHIDEHGFIFYTNYTSQKAKNISENPQANLLFFWPMLERQVNISGSVKKIDRASSEAYFHSRPRGSQISAYASHQSSPIESRQALEHSVSELEEKFEGKEIELPDYWGGYRLTPHRFEFWQGRTSRLHDRIEYNLQDSKWHTTRLCP